MAPEAGAEPERAAPAAREWATARTDVILRRVPGEQAAFYINIHYLLDALVESISESDGSQIEIDPGVSVSVTANNLKLYVDKCC